MAITSIGYDGTVDEVQWAKLHPAAANRPCVTAGSSISIVSGVDRTVRAPSGVEAYGYGVYDINGSSVDLQAGSVASGSRWDTVVLRRDWSTNTSAFMILPGTSTQAISASLQSNPGVVADQVFALIRLDAGQTAVQQVVDLREWHTSPFVSASGITWPDANLYPYGQITVQSDGKALDVGVRRGTNPSGYWDKILTRSWNDLPLSGSVAAGDLAQYRVVGDCLELRGQVQPAAGGSFSTSFLTVATLATSLRPQFGAQFAVGAGGVSASTYHALLQIRSATDGGTIEVKTSGTGVTYIRLDGVRISLS